MKKVVGLVLNDPIAYSETFFYNDIRILQRAGFDVIVFTGYSKKKIEGLSHVRAFPTFIHSFKDFGFAFIGLLNLFLKGLKPAYTFYKHEKKQGTGLFRRLKRIFLSGHILPYKIDYLHFGFATSALQRELVAKSINAKMSISLRGYDIGVYPLLNPDCYRRLWPLVDQVHITSFELYLAAIKHGMHKTIAHKFIPLAIETKSMPKRNNGAHECNSTKIITVGRLHWKKGYEYALQAIHNLIEKGIAVDYTIIGDGPHKDAIIYSIHQLSLQDRVTLMGVLSHEEVLSKMCQSEIYLQPSIQEGFCCAALEAQAVGLLVIATDAEGLQENIENERSGWIVPKRNVEEISNKILEVINLPVEKKKEITDYARKRVVENFDLENNVDHWKSFFN